MMKRTARCRRFVQTKSLSPHLKYYMLHSNVRRKAVSGAPKFLHHLSDLLVRPSAEKDFWNPETNTTKQEIDIYRKRGAGEGKRTISSSVDNGGEFRRLRRFDRMLYIYVSGTFVSEAVAVRYYWRHSRRRQKQLEA